MLTPEGHEKRDIKKYLDSIHAWYFLPYMAGFGKAGVADIIACIDGYFWSIEVKREGKEPTPRQAARMVEVQRSRGLTTWGTAAKVIAEIEAWREQRARTAS